MVDIDLPLILNIDLPLMVDICTKIIITKYIIKT